MTSSDADYKEEHSAEWCTMPLASDLEDVNQRKKVVESEEDKLKRIFGLKMLGRCNNFGHICMK